MTNKDNWEKEFDEKFVDKDGSIDVINLNKGVMEYPRAKEIKRFIRSLLASQRGEIEEDKRELLNRYSDWLNKKGYIDSDYYTEEPKAVDWFLSELKDKDE